MKKRLLCTLLALCMTLGLFPVSVFAAASTQEDGWYQLRTMNNYLNIDSKGNAELRDKGSENESFQLTNMGQGHVTLKRADGTFLGAAAVAEDGTQVVAMKEAYLWTLYPEKGDDIFSIRPFVGGTRVLNASGAKNTDGTKITLWTYDLDAPNHAEFRFILTKENESTDPVEEPQPKPSQPPTSGNLTATPSTTGFMMEGKTVSVPEAYAVGGNNYLQLRGIAVLLNGTASQFNVGWDGTYAVIETGKPYTGTSNPATLAKTTDVRKSSTQFKIDSGVTGFDNAYYIGGNSNYIQLREVAEKLAGTASAFNVYWDSSAAKAVIVPGEAYTGNPPSTTEVKPTPEPTQKPTTSLTKMDMTYIPAGSYIDDYFLTREVTISQPFYMGTYEVTQEQFKAVMGWNPSLLQGTGKVSTSDSNGTAHVYNRTPASGEDPNKRPVERVSWFNAIVFCNKLSIQEGLTPAYSLGGHTDPKYWGRTPNEQTGESEVWNEVKIVQGSTGYRLPTEAQWEYAARGNGSPTVVANETGWYADNSNRQTHQVGKKAPNAFGLYDIYGNVSEYVWDWKHADPPIYDQTDPMGSFGNYDNNPNMRGKRGGSFIDKKESCRAKTGHSFDDYASRNIMETNGFRIMRPDPATFEHTDKPVVQGMTWIPGGTYTMGSPESEAGHQNSETQKQVTVEGFYMDTCELKQTDLYGFSGKYYGYHIRHAFHLAASESWAGLPAESVSWYDAIKLCNIRSVAENLEPAYSIKGSTNPSKWGLVPTKQDADWDAVKIVEGANGYRLPTAAQWEYACRAGTTTAYNNGADSLREGDIRKENLAWYNQTSMYRGEGGLKTHEVGFLPANAFGLHDMHGNVSEWCWDETSDGKRAYRGGSYRDDANGIRSAARFHKAPYEAVNYLGLRMVRPYAANMPEKPALIPDTGMAWTAPIQDGWYEVRMSHMYLKNITGDMKYDRRVVAGDKSKILKVYIKNIGHNKLTIRDAQGQYWGIEGEIKRRADLRLVNKPFEWYLTFETGGLRPASNTGYVLIMNGKGTGMAVEGYTFPVGTQICLTERKLPNKDFDELGNSVFRFYPTKAPSYYSWKGK